MDRLAFNAKQRERRKLNGNSTTKKYEKTKKGFLMRLYRNMKSRIVGIQKVKFHLYKGKELSFSREEFYDQYLNDAAFNGLFDTWEYYEYDRKLTPSLDRVDSSKGYQFDNLEWVTHSENSRRGAVSKERKKVSIQC